MAHQASQVFYVKDPASDHWFVALHGKKEIDVNEERLSNLHIADSHPFKTTINFDKALLLDDVHVIWEDRNERIYM